MARDPFNFNLIETGQIYAGSMPTCAADIETLYCAGVKQIITLTQRQLFDCEDVRDAMSDVHMVDHHCPQSDGGVNEEIGLATIRLLKVIASIGISPTYIHCRAGVGRTGTILIAHYLINRNHTLEQAYEMARRRVSTVNLRMADDLSAVQHEWLRSLVDRLPELRSEILRG